MQSAVASVAGVNPSFMRTADKATALSGLAVLSTQVDELRMRIMADAEDVAAEVAARDVAGCYAHETRTDPVTAKADAALAVDLDRRWTVLAAGMRTGEVSLAQSRVIARCLTALAPWVDPEILEEAQDALVELAEDHGPRQLAALGKRILSVVAPDLADEIEALRLEAEEADAQDKISLNVRHHADGTIRGNFVLDKLSGTRFAVLLDAFTNPRKDNACNNSTSEPDAPAASEAAEPPPPRSRVRTPTRSSDSLGAESWARHSAHCWSPWTPTRCRGTEATRPCCRSPSGSRRSASAWPQAPS